MPTYLRFLPQLCVASLALASVASAQSKPARPIETPPAAIEDSVDKDYASELPRLPALPLEEVVSSVEVAEGFELKLIAHEPLVFDPVAFAYDAKLRLYVVEMRDYSEQETEHLGSIVRLEDTDQDGVFDKRSVLVEGLSWPTAIWPWRDGVIVAEPPRLTWYRDTDDDGRSDQSEDWYIGFGRGNVQGLVNSLRWGVDGYLHGATSSSGAELDSPLSPSEPVVALGRRDFAIDPLTRALQAESGGGQHGMSFNRWGDKFATSNSDHLQQIIDLEWWLKDHTTSIAIPSSRRSIAVDGPQAEVYRASPVEPWRIVRTRLRMSGVAPGVVEGGGRAAGYFTGATGTLIMDREAGFGDPEHDTAIVCDVGSNLVHRKRMEDHGLFWSGQRIDQESELVRSKDVWFRPVQIGDSPDGALIIADMAREVIEHPKSLPPMIKKHLDLTSGRDRGRIWRLVPQGTAARRDPAPATLSSAQLVANLAHPVAWQRRMASQLLIERQARDVQSELQQAALNHDAPAAQVLAMHVLSRLQLFTPELAQQLIQASHPRVVQHAVRLIGIHHLPIDLSSLANSQSPRVQMEVALSAAADNVPAAQRDQWLTSLLPQVHEPLVQALVANVAGQAGWEMIEQQSTALSRADRSAWLRLFLPGWASRLSDDGKLRTWMLGKLLADNDEGRDWRIALASTASRAEVSLIRTAMQAEQLSKLAGRVETDLEAALDSSSSSLSSFHGIRLLDNDSQLTFAKQLLGNSSSQGGQRAVLSLLGWSDQLPLAQLVIDQLPTLTPALQAEALRGLAGREAAAQLLAESVEQSKVQASLFPIELREQLLRGQNKQLAARFEKLFGQTSSDRQAVIERYTSGLEQASSPGDRAAGQQVFRQVCAQCHRLSELGNDVGPPLKQLADKSPQQLLETILDPNREIDPKYMSYTVLDEDDRVLTGIIQDETSGQIVLKSPGGEVHTLARESISQIKSSGVSLMPVGLEASINVEQMRQLIEFLKSAQPQ